MTIVRLQYAMCIGNAFKFQNFFVVKNINKNNILHY